MDTEDPHPTLLPMWIIFVIAVFCCFMAAKQDTKIYLDVPTRGSEKDCNK